MLIKLKDAPTFDTGGGSATGYVSPSRGGHDTSVWRLRVEPGTGSPFHTVSREEVFMSLAGTVTATIDGEDVVVEAGDALMVPPQVPFRIVNSGSEPWEAVVCMPAGATGTILPDGPTIVPRWAE